jgi:hypothetical protein
VNQSMKWEDSWFHSTKTHTIEESSSLMTWKVRIYYPILLRIISLMTLFLLCSQNLITTLNGIDCSTPMISLRPPCWWRILSSTVCNTRPTTGNVIGVKKDTKLKTITVLRMTSSISQIVSNTMVSLITLSS